MRNPNYIKMKSTITNYDIAWQKALYKAKQQIYDLRLQKYINSKLFQDQIKASDAYNQEAIFKVVQIGSQSWYMKQLQRISRELAQDMKISIIDYDFVFQEYEFKIPQLSEIKIKLKKSSSQVFKLFFSKYFTKLFDKGNQLQSNYINLMRKNTYFLSQNAFRQQNRQASLFLQSQSEKFYQRQMVEMKLLEKGQGFNGIAVPELQSFISSMDKMF